MSEVLVPRQRVHTLRGGAAGAPAIPTTGAAPTAWTAAGEAGVGAAAAVSAAPQSAQNLLPEGFCIRQRGHATTCAGGCAAGLGAT